MKKINQIINSIMGAFIGVFIGHSIYDIWNYKMQIDNIGWLGFFGVCVPVICLIGGIFLLFTAFYRRKNKLPCLQTAIFAIVLLLVPVVFIIMLFLIGVLGIGPVPN